MTTIERRKGAATGLTHVAGTREPRRSGNPFLDDDEEEVSHSSSVLAAPHLALPRSTTPPWDASKPPSAGLRSPQEALPPASTSADKLTDSQAPIQQALGPASTAAEQHTHLAPSAISSSHAPPASPVGMDRQASRQHSGQVQDRAGQVGSRAGQASGPMHQSRSGHMPITHPHPRDSHVDQRPPEIHPQEPAHSTGPAGLSNSSEAIAAAAAASNSAHQQSSIDSGVSQQASVPAESGARQPWPASAQLHQGQTGAVPEVQVVQAAEQGSQAAPDSLPRLESGQHQPGSIRPGAGGEMPSIAPSQEILVPPVPHMQAALSQTQPGMSTSSQGPVNRGSAGPVLPLQQQLQSSFPRAPPPTADMQVYEPPPKGNPPPRQGGQQGGSTLQESGLEGMLGRSAPDSDIEEEESAASSQDRQRFMQSLHSPDQGASRSRNLAKGFGRMRAKAKDMLQAKKSGSPRGPSTRSAQQASPQGLAGGTAPTPTDTELGKRGRLARDMTMMFAGLKKPTNQQ